MTAGRVVPKGFGEHLKPTRADDGLLVATLEVAVPAWIDQLRHAGEERRAERVRICAQAVAETATTCCSARQSAAPRREPSTASPRVWPAQRLTRRRSGLQAPLSGVAAHVPIRRPAMAWPRQRGARTRPNMALLDHRYKQGKGAEDDVDCSGAPPSFKIGRPGRGLLGADVFSRMATQGLDAPPLRPLHAGGTSGRRRRRRPACSTGVSYPALRSARATGAGRAGSLSSRWRRSRTFVSSHTNRTVRAAMATRASSAAHRAVEPPFRSAT